MTRTRWQITIFGLMIVAVCVAAGLAFARAILDSKPRSSPLAVGQEVTLRSDYVVIDREGEANYRSGTRCVVVRDLAASAGSRWDQRRQVEVRVDEGHFKGSVLQLPRWLVWAR